MITVGVATQARVALSAALAYTMRREAFSRRLIEQPVIRHRLARCGAQLESLWSWIESFVYQMRHLAIEEAETRLGGLTAQAKAQAGMVLDECAQCVVLLFGGNGYTKGGQGEIAEMLYREGKLGMDPHCP